MPILSRASRSAGGTPSWTRSDMYPNSVTFDPGLLWLDDEPESDPIDTEILTVTASYIWWSAPTADEDE